MLMLPLPAKAELDQLVETATDRFFEECLSAIENPSAYIARARNAPPDGQVELITNDEGGLYYVRDATPPGEVTVQFGQAAPNRLWLLCRSMLYNDPNLMDSAATKEAFDHLLESRRELRSVGGEIELRNPIAGASSETAEMLYHVATIYSHRITGWSDSGHVAQAGIQVNMYEINATIWLTENLTIEE